MHTRRQYLTITTVMLLVAAIILALAAIRGPLRTAAWSDECAELDRGGAIRLSHIDETIPCPPGGTS